MAKKKRNLIKNLRIRENETQAHQGERIRNAKYNRKYKEMKEVKV